jgi:hypothetical protein
MTPKMQKDARAVSLLTRALCWLNLHRSVTNIRYQDDESDDPSRIVAVGMCPDCGDELDFQADEL